jgi:glycosyltransferase involved in cell wall biosynthesis
MRGTSGVNLSVVVPVYNEADGLKDFHTSLTDAVRKVVKDGYEIIYCDDGSTDDTAKLVTGFNRANSRIKLLKLSRNFGKEIATTAGIHQARGQAVITIDGDGQHPVNMIADFIKLWQQGSKVVIGVRTANQKEGLVKRLGSKLFYGFFNRFTGMHLLPRSTDFRLIDKAVQRDFIQMTERNRITRGLIDWLGYPRDYINFKANVRTTGRPGYSFRKMFKLAIDSAISLSISPLYITAYIGAIVLPLSALLGLFMLGNLVLGDPAHLHATGSAYLMVFLLFMVGILLVSQGIIGLYLSHIHTETQNRPLYVVDKAASKGVAD